MFNKLNDNFRRVVNNFNTILAELFVQFYRITAKLCERFVFINSVDLFKANIRVVLRIIEYIGEFKSF